MPDNKPLYSDQDTGKLLETYQLYRQSKIPLGDLTPRELRTPNPTEITSIHDKGFAIPETGGLESLNEQRAQEQGVGKKIGLDLAKTGILFSTTFLQSTVGFATGAISSLINWDIREMTTNPFTGAMNSVNDWSEQVMPNYYTREELTSENPFMGIIPGTAGSTNFWFDKVVKNIGFSMGALAAGFATGGLSTAIGKGLVLGIDGLIGKSLLDGFSKAVTLGKYAELEAGMIKPLEETLKNLGRLRLQTATELLTAGAISASGESSIEGYQGYKDVKEKLTAKAIQDLDNANPYKQHTEDDLNHATRTKIEEDSKNSAFSRYSMNMPLLMITHIVEFASLLKGYNQLRKSVAKTGIETVEKEGVFSLIPKSTIGKIAVAGKTIASESFEEGSQFAFEKGTQDYALRKYDNDKIGKITDIMTSVNKGIYESLQTKEGQQNWILGALSGGLFGMGINYMQGKNVLTGENKNKSANDQKTVDLMNEYLATGKVSELFDKSVRHQSIQEDFNKAVESGDIYKSKNLKADRFVNFVTAAINSGNFEVFMNKLETLKTFKEEDFKTTFGIDYNEANNITMNKYIDNMIKDAKSVRNIADAINLKYPGISSTIKDMLFHSSFRIQDVDNRIKKISQDILQKTGIDFNTIRGLQSTPEQVKEVTKKLDKAKKETRKFRIFKDGEYDYSEEYYTSDEYYNLIAAQQDFDDLSFNERLNKNYLADFNKKLEDINPVDRKAIEQQEKDLKSLDKDRVKFIKSVKLLIKEEQHQKILKDLEAKKTKKEKEEELLKNKDILDRKGKHISTLLSHNKKDSKVNLDTVYEAAKADTEVYNKYKSDIDRAYHTSNDIISKLNPDTTTGTEDTEDTEDALWEEYGDRLIEKYGKGIKVAWDQNDEAWKRDKIKGINPFFDDKGESHTGKFEDENEDEFDPENPDELDNTDDEDLSDDNEHIIKDTTDVDFIQYKKKIILSIAWLHKLFHLDAHDNIVEENKTNELLDTLILSHRAFNIGDKLEVTVDWDQAALIDLFPNTVTEADFYKLPFKVNRPGIAKAGAIHRLDEPNADIDTHVVKYVERTLKDGSNDDELQRQETKKLQEFRKFLFEYLVTSKNPKLDITIDSKSTGSINFVDKPVPTLFGLGNGTKLADGVTFGIVVPKSTTGIEWNGEQPLLVSHFDNTKLKKGSLVVSLPSTIKNPGSKVQNQVVYLHRNKISESDAEVVLHIIKNYGYYEDKGISELKDKFPILADLGITRVSQLLSLLIYEGKNSSFRIERNSKGVRYLISTKGSSIKSGIAITDANENRILDIIKKRKYNINSSFFNRIERKVPVFQLVGNTLDVKEEIPYSQYIAQRTMSDVQGERVEDTNEYNFFNQPTIGYTYDANNQKVDEKVEVKEEVKPEVEVKTGNDIPEETRDIPESDDSSIKGDDFDELGINKDEDETPSFLEIQDLGSQNYTNQAKLQYISTSKNRYDTVLGLITALDDPGLTQIIQRLHRYFNGKKVVVELVNKPGNKAAKAVIGKDGSLTIELNENVINRSGRGIEYIIAHELVHLGSIDGLHNNPKFKAKITELYNYAKSKLPGGYHFKNEREFLAEGYSNPEVRQQLKNLKYRKEDRNIFEKIIDYIIELFNSEYNSVYYLMDKYTNEYLNDTQKVTKLDGTEYEDPYFIESNKLEGFSIFDSINAVKSISGMIQGIVLRDIANNPQEDDVKKEVFNNLVTRYHQLIKAGIGKVYSDNLTKLINGGIKNEVFNKLFERSNIEAKKLLEFVNEDDVDMPLKGKESYGREAYQLNSKSSMSKRLKQRLSSIKNTRFKYDEKGDKIYDNLGNPKIETIPSVIGLVTFIPVNAIYNTLAVNMVDKTMQEIEDDLENLSKYNPIIYQINKVFKEAKASKDLNDLSSYNEFLSNFSKTHLKFLTFQFQDKNNNTTTRVINSNRAELDDVILAKWYENFIFLADKPNSILTYKDGNLVVNTVLGKEMLDSFNEKITETSDNKDLKEKIKTVYNSLSNIGIILNRDVVDFLMDEKNHKQVSKNFIIQQFVESARTILSKLAGSEKINEDEPLNANNPFGDSKELKSLLTFTKIESLLSTNLFSASMRNEENKTIYTISQNSFMSKRTKALKDRNPVLYKHLKDSPYHTDSYALNRLIEDDEFLKAFDVNYVSVFNEIGKAGEGKPYNEITEEEREFTKLMGFIGNTGKLDNKGYFIDATNSDKSTTIVLTMLKRHVTVNNNMLDPATLNILYKTFLGEAKRMDAANKMLELIESTKDPVEKKRLSDLLVLDYHLDDKGNQGAAFKIHFFPTLNNFKLSNGKTIKETILDKGFDFKNNNNKYQKEITKELNNIVFDKVRLQIEYWKELGLVKIDPKTGEYLDELNPKFLDKDYLKKAAEEKNYDFNLNYVVNYMLAYATSYQLYSNDIAYAKDVVNQSKRNANKIAPGLDMNLDNEEPMRIWVIEDSILPTKMYDKMFEDLNKQYKGQTKLNKILDHDELVDKYVFRFKVKVDSDEYKDILTWDVPKLRSRLLSDAFNKTKNADGQTYLSLKEYALWMKGLGRLTTKLEKIINKAKSKITLTPEEVTHILEETDEANNIINKHAIGPQKPMYSEDVWNKHLNLFQRHYIKTSIFPLFKELTESYTELDDLRNQMEDANVGMVTYPSSYKEGAYNVQKFYDEHYAGTNKLDPNKVIELPYSGLRLQQEVPYDIEHDEIRGGSQEGKLVFGDLLDPALDGIQFTLSDGQVLDSRQLKSHFDDLRNSIIVQNAEKFKKEFGVVFNPNKGKTGSFEITDLSKVQKILLEELEKNRGISGNTKDIIELVDVENPVQGINKLLNKRFNIPLYFSPKHTVFESLLNSVVSNRIIKLKYPGNSFVQGSNAMFNGAFSKDQMVELANLNKSDKEKIEWVLSQKNTLSHMHIDASGQIIEPMQVILPYPYKELFKSGKMDNKDILRTFGFRIPTQGLSSMASIEVVGFLPQSSGNLIIIPHEFVTQSSSDFDVDKLYIYFWNVDKDGNKIEFLQDSNKLWENYKQKYINSKKGRQIAEEIGLSIVDDITFEMSYAKIKNEGLNKIDEIEDLFNIPGATLNDLLLALQDDINMLSEEEFKKLSIINQNTKQARENQMLDIRMSIMKNPKIFDKILNPNALDDIKRVNKYLEDIVKPLPEIDPLSIISQDNLYEANQSGKKGVAIMSLWSTLLAQLQYTNVHGTIYDKVKIGDVIKNILNGVGIKFLDSNNKLIEEFKNSSDEYQNQIDNSLFKDEQDIDDSNKNVGLYKFNKVRGHFGNLISDLILQLQTAAVDNAKEQELFKAHLNDDTFGVASILAYAGIDKFDYIIPFLKQEIIVDFVKAKKKFKSKINQTYEVGNIVDKAKNKIWNRIIHKIIDLDPSYKNIIKSQRLYNEVFNSKNIKAFSKDDLIKSINKDVVKDVDYYLNQLSVLNAFVTYSMTAEELFTAVSALNMDTAGLGINYYSIVDRFNKILKVKNNKFSTISNIKDLLKGTLPDTYFNNAVSLAKDIFADDRLLPFNQALFLNSTEAILRNSSKNELNEDMSQAINHGINAFIGTLNANGIYEPGTDVSELRKQLMMDSKDNKSLVTRLKEHLTSNNNEGRWLLNRMNLNRSVKKNELSTITYKRNLLEPDEEEIATESIIEMLMSNKPEVVKLAEDLIAYSYLTAGPNLTSTGFNHIIPVQYLSEKGFGIYFSSAFYKNSQTEELIARFVRQFFRNNPKEAFLMEDTKVKIAKGMQSFEYESLAGPPSDYVRIYIKRMGITLWEYVNTNNETIHVYKRLNLLGGAGIKYGSKIDEYNAQHNNTEPINTADKVTKDITEISVSPKKPIVTPKKESYPTTISTDEGSVEVDNTERGFNTTGEWVEPGTQLSLFNNPFFDENGKSNTGDVSTEEFTQPTSKDNIVAIIGTAGRSQVPTIEEWNNMLADARSRINPNNILISGGAAFADHIAVKLFLEGSVAGLKLRLPAKIKDGKFVGGYGTAGGTANFYHAKFNKITGENSIAEIENAIKKGAEVTYETEVSNKAMFIRNEKVAKEAGKMLAYTYGTSDVPADGGTKDTWDKHKGFKTHISIGKIQQSTSQSVSKVVENNLNSKVIEGDIFAQEGIPVIPTNLGGVHGAGLAKLARNKGLLSNNNKVDTSYDAKASRIVFPVKKTWSDKTDINLLKNSMNKLINTANKSKDKTFLLPLVGLGHGEGSISEIMPIIVDALNNTTNIKLILPTKDAIKNTPKGNARTDNSLDNIEEIKSYLTTKESQSETNDLDVQFNDNKDALIKKYGVGIEVDWKKFTKEEKEFKIKCIKK